MSEVADATWRPRSLPRKAGDTALELNLHGLLRVHLINARPEDQKSVADQLGLGVQQPTGVADLLVRYREPLERENLQLLGTGQAGYTERGEFLIRHGSDDCPLEVSLPFEEQQAAPQIVAAHGTKRIPLLRQLLNRIAIAKGILPLHASAFEFHGRGVMMMGWCEGGKTETLLGFLDRGAALIADDWVYLNAAQDEMFGLPAPMTLWDWHLREVPSLRRHVGWWTRCRWRTIRMAASAAGGLAESRLLHRFVPSRFLRRLSRLLRRQLQTELPLANLTKHSDTSRLRGPIDDVFLVLNHTSPDVRVDRISSAEAAEKMAACLEFEQQALQLYRWMTRFAFPHQSSSLLEQPSAAQHELLQHFLQSRQVRVISHPYPAPVRRIVEAVEPLLLRGGT